jgi:predicted GIY-YIG superfamily endonuclease
MGPQTEIITKSPEYWVYVIQSQMKRIGKRNVTLPGFYYVGMTVDLKRRLRQHNGEISGGGKYTSKFRPWVLMAVYGPYANKSEALKAERALKHSKRGASRTKWTSEDSHWCRGLGDKDPRVSQQTPKSGSPCPAS